MRVEDKKELHDPRYFVSMWFHKIKGFKMLPNGNFIGQTVATFDDLQVDYLLYFKKARKDARIEAEEDKEDGDPSGKSRIGKFADNILKAAWNSFLVKAQEDAREDIIKTIRFSGVSDKQLVGWLNCTIGSATDFQIGVMKHVLWSVKRKAFGMPVVYTISPSFWGLQGGGKTTAIRRLIEPIEKLTIEWSPDQAIDARNTQTLADNLVVIFDEMAGLQRVEIEALKRVISTDYTSYRPLYSNRALKVRQNCTFIGISNKSLTENICDATGLRRFVDFKCLDVMDWTALNNINILDIWQCVDENIERGYLEAVMAELKEHQADLGTEDEMQTFVRETALSPVINLPTVEISNSDLWKFYVLWHSTSGFEGKAPLNIRSLGMKLRSHDVKKKSIRIGGKEKVFYIINKAATIFETQTPTVVKQLEFKKESV